MGWADWLAKAQGLRAGRPARFYNHCAKTVRSPEFGSMSKPDRTNIPRLVSDIKTLSQALRDGFSEAELARANGIKAILCSVLPAYDFPWRPGLEPAEKIVALNKWIKEYSLKNGFIYLDYFSCNP